MRDEVVSIAKAIGIMLMVLAHTWFSQVANHWINMFHMPLFFILSGYCFKEKWLADVIGYTIRRMKSIYIPFVKWSLLFLLLHNLFFRLNIINDSFGWKGTVSSLYTIHDFFVHIFRIVVAMADSECFLGGYWFLKSLLYASFFSYLLLKYLPVKLSIVLTMLLTMATSYYELSIPFIEVGQSEIFATTFVLSGFEIRRFGGANVISSNLFWILVGISIVLVSIGTVYWQAIVPRCEWWKVIPYYITAIAGSMSVLLCSRLICGMKHDGLKRKLVFIGDNTMSILTWHMLSFKLVTLTIICIYNLPIEHLAEFPAIESYSAKGWFVAYFAIGIGLPICSKKILSKTEMTRLFKGIFTNKRQ